MKEHSIAVSVSVLFHIIIVAIFLRVPFDQYIKPKLMVLDFSIEKGRAVSNGEHIKTEDGKRESRNSNRETQIANHKSQIVNRTIENEGTIINREQNSQNKFAAEPSSELKTVTSDPTGQVMVRGETGPVGAKADSISGKNISVGEGSGNLPAGLGNIRVVDYGKDGSGARDYPFINDILHKRFQKSYPEKALDRRWEGEVILSFIISENGDIQDVKVVHSSGYRTFDDHARKIVKETSFNRKLPDSLRINNYKVTYKLQ